MSQGGNDGVTQPSIDAILRGLANRPNVEATLILSRKDGSVIKATGFASPDKQAEMSYSKSMSAQDNERNNPRDINSNEAVITQVLSKDGSSTMEDLANAIFRYVSAAASLAAVVHSCSTTRDEIEGLKAITQQSKTAQSHNDTTNEDIGDLNDGSNMQLLRLRTKQQEIIIFPDPHYLSCVVQRVGK